VHAVTAVPRLLTQLIPGIGDLPLGTDVWQDTILLLPRFRPQQRLRNVFTGEVHSALERGGEVVLPLAEVFANFPVALLLAVE
jgi:maltooligosyltrehalose synthase